MSDGIYLLNCTRGSQQKSSIAYYRKFAQISDGNDGQLPDALVDVTSTDQGFVRWEGGQGSVTFQDGVKVTWFIEGNGQSQPQNEVTGSASNGFHNWTVRRDKGTKMFSTADGFDCFKIYFAE